MGSLTRSISTKMMQLAFEREKEGIKSLVDHSQATLDKGQEVKNGIDTSTIVTAGVQDERLNGGRETVIPTLWEGKIYDLRMPEERETVIQFALASGKKWPSADPGNLLEANIIDEFAHQTIRKQLRRE